MRRNENEKAKLVSLRLTLSSLQFTQTKAIRTVWQLRKDYKYPCEFTYYSLFCVVLIRLTSTLPQSSTPSTQYIRSLHSSITQSQQPFHQSSRRFIRNSTRSTNRHNQFIRTRFTRLVPLVILLRLYSQSRSHLLHDSSRSIPTSFPNLRFPRLVHHWRFSYSI